MSGALHLAQRKQLLQTRATLERIELTQHVSNLKPTVSLLSTGNAVMQQWRGKSMVGTVLGLLVTRTALGARFGTALRWAGYGYAAWKTWESVSRFRRAALPSLARGAKNQEK